MNEPLDELYFTWLYRQVASVKAKRPHQTYWSLFRQLFTKEFVWLIPNDDNRVEDGRDLRYEFLNEEELTADSEWMTMGCSMLEMLIGLARRLAFETDGQPRACFWLLLENVGLEGHTDAVYKRLGSVDVEDILDTIIWRRYQPNGEGGLFPLRKSKKDQRVVELWYQLNAYIQENP